MLGAAADQLSRTGLVVHDRSDQHPRCQRAAVDHMELVTLANGCGVGRVHTVYADRNTACIYRELVNMRGILVTVIALAAGSAHSADLPLRAQVVETAPMDYETCAETAGDIAEYTRGDPLYVIKSQRYLDRERYAQVVIRHRTGQPAGEIICHKDTIQVIEYGPPR